MLDSFIKHGLTQLEAESESLLQILAGSDLTATAIRMSVLCLLTNPPVYAKLRNEVDNAVQSGTISKIVQVSYTPSLSPSRHQRNDTSVAASYWHRHEDCTSGWTHVQWHQHPWRHIIGPP